MFVKFKMGKLNVVAKGASTNSLRPRDKDGNNQIAEKATANNSISSVRHQGHQLKLLFINQFANTNDTNHNNTACSNTTDPAPNKPFTHTTTIPNPTTFNQRPNQPPPRPPDNHTNNDNNSTAGAH
jgi:hypothetical protein